MIDIDAVRFYATKGFNVMFHGQHGIGKTTIIKNIWDELGLKYLYFSAATMDPWVDFIGVPKETTDENGVRYLELIRPKHFAYDDVEAIFMDEFNRAPKKVRNAVMELLQFKSINGKKFNNLKMVWTAVNPPADTDFSYDVEMPDPAQEDRFHIHIHIPFTPDPKYFLSKYGENGEVACKWWNELPEEIQKKVSPRRLDYALEIYEEGGDVRHVVHESTLPNKLVEMLSHGSISKKLTELFNKQDYVQAEKWLSKRNHFEAAWGEIAKKLKFREFFLPLVGKEDIAAKMSSSTEFSLLKHVCYNYNIVPKFKEICDEILATSNNEKLKETIQRELDSNLPDASTVDFESIVGKTAIEPSFVEQQSEGFDFNKELEVLANANTAIEQTAVLTHFSSNMTKDMSDEFCNASLKFLNEYCSNTRSQTLFKNKDKVLNIFNAVAKQQLSQAESVNAWYRGVMKKYYKMYIRFMNANIVGECYGKKG